MIGSGPGPSATVIGSGLNPSATGDRVGSRRRSRADQDRREPPFAADPAQALAAVQGCPDTGPWPFFGADRDRPEQWSAAG